MIGSAANHILGGATCGGVVYSPAEQMVWFDPYCANISGGAPDAKGVVSIVQAQP